MKVRFWGTRGSIPTPGPRTAIYGGNTSCVEVSANDGTLIVLDCGTGVRELGLDLLKRPGPHRINLFIGHTHWDHIQGFPFFIPAFVPGTELNIYAPAGFQRNLEEALAGQMQYAYFPVKLQDLASHIHFAELEEGFFRIGDVLVETHHLNHTAPTVAYRISADGASVAYVTDHEPFWRNDGKAFSHPGDQEHVAFLRNVDLVIHDAQYTNEEYQTKLGWGHSTIDYAIDVALAANVRQLALFHHDPTHDDTVIEAIELKAQERVRSMPLEVFAAREGVTIDVTGQSERHSESGLSALETRPIAGCRILVITENMKEFIAIEQILTDDGLLIAPAADMRIAAEKADLAPPDMIIASATLLDTDGEAVLAKIRKTDGGDLPLLVLTTGLDAPAVALSPNGITDHLAKPFSPPMLRSRVRAWLARTIAGTAPGGGRAPKRQPQSYAEILAAVPLFQTLRTDELDRLLSRVTSQTYAPGQVIIRQGEPAQTVYVLISGRVRIVESLPDSPVEMFLGELGHGEVFGELGILRDQPRSATILCLERSTCLVFPNTDFLAVLQNSPEMSLALLRVLAKRLHNADRMLSRYAPDPLTGLPGRRAFHDLYARLSASARRRGCSILLIVLDVVNLRSINDRHGYNTGDDSLRVVADALLESSRTTDLVARYGGDEFAALLLDARTVDIDSLVERIRVRIRETSKRRKLPISVEVNAGYSFTENPPDNADELLRLADADMHARRTRPVSTD